MKESEIEYIGCIPDTWNTLKLKYGASKIERGTPPDYADDGVSVVNQATFSKGYFDDTNMRFSTKKPEISRGLLIINDVLLASTGGGVLGKTHYFQQPGTFVADSHVSIIRTEQKVIDSKYLFYFFSINYDTFNALMAAGSTNQTELQRDLLSNMKIPLPSVRQQKAIVSFLDSHCAEIDAMIADAKANIEDYKTLKQTIITQAVTKGLDPDVEMKESGIEWVGEMPSSWTLQKGKCVFTQRSERGNSKSLGLLSPSQQYGVIPQTLLETKTTQRTVKVNEKADLSQFKTVHCGDFCISLRSFQGGFEYSQYEGVVSPAYQVFYPLVHLCDKYFRFMFKEPGFIAEMNSYTMTLRDGKNIAFSDFGNSLLPIPPVEEQIKIAAFLTSRCAEIDSIITEQQALIEELEAAKKSLIYECVTGKREIPV